MNFRDALRHERETLARHATERAALEAEYQTCVFHAYKASHPKRKCPADLGKLFRKAPELVAGIKEFYSPRAEALTERHKTERDAAKEAAVIAAEGYVPRRTDGKVWTLLRVVWSSTYSSQGYGAVKYAHEAANRVAADAEYHGISAKVVKFSRGRCGRWGIESATFYVWAATDSLGVEALERKGGPPMREWLRSCWSRGVNPRVYCPFLPMGLEEKLGLDYFGGEHRGAQCTALVAV